jgi:hypothetical protein
MDCSWAAELLQQLQNCVAAGLMRALPGGTAAEAAALFSRAAGSSSSSSSGGELLGVLTEQVYGGIKGTFTCFIEEALRKVLPQRSSVAFSVSLWHSFLAQPAITDYALQLLASHCLVLHEQHVQQLQQQRQQQRRLLASQQLGRRMRGDLLLLPSPQQVLLQLLPGDAFHAAEAQGDFIHADYAQSLHWQASDLLQALDVSLSSINSSRSSSLPALSPASLQLVVQLLLLAAGSWQHHYHSLTEKQQHILIAVDGAIDAVDLLQATNSEISAAKDLFLRSSHLLHKQINWLWGSGQWQPLFQLLQQGGGEELLQGLTLAVRCSSLDARMKESLVKCYGHPASVWHLEMFLPGERDQSGVPAVLVCHVCGPMVRCIWSVVMLTPTA